jgi:hypothetical protein
MPPAYVRCCGPCRPPGPAAAAVTLPASRRYGSMDPGPGARRTPAIRPGTGFKLVCFFRRGSISDDRLDHRTVSDGHLWLIVRKKMSEDRDSD